jgi:hypothetical protein
MTFQYTLSETTPSAQRGDLWFRAKNGAELYDSPYFIVAGGKLLESLPTEEAAITNARKAVEWYKHYNCEVPRSVFRFTGFCLQHIATFGGPEE